MSDVFGVTLDGFVIKPLSQIQQETEADFRSKFGEGINLDPQSPLGVIKGIIDAQLASLWELSQAIYFSQYPQTAEGINLDNVVSLTGITREGATKSTCSSGRARGDFGTVIPAETVISVLGNPASRFLTNTDETISIAAIDEVQTITFASTPDAGSFTLILGSLETIDIPFDAIDSDIIDALESLLGAGNVDVVGDFATGFVVTFQNDEGGLPQFLLNVGSNSLTTSSVSSAITIVETTPGDYAKTPLMNLTSETAGDFQAPINSLTVIETPVVGLQFFINETAADVGKNIETDAALKLRRIQELELSGVGTVNAIRAHLLTVANVDAAFVFENDSDSIDGVGRPPHSVDAIVQGGDETDIAQSLFNTVPAGIGYFGGVIINVQDSQGFEHEIKFSRPSEVNAYMILDLTTNADYPVDGDDQVIAAMVAYGLTLTLGEDLVVYGSKSVLAAISTVTGITDVTVRVGTSVIPADGTHAVTISNSGGFILFTWSSHTLIVGNQVTFTNSGGSLPTNISAGVVYWVRFKDANTFTVSETRTGDAVAYSASGSGTQTVHFGGRDDNIETNERELIIVQSPNIEVNS